MPKDFLTLDYFDFKNKIALVRVDIIVLSLILIFVSLPLPTATAQEAGVAEIYLLGGEIEYPLEAKADVKQFYFSTAIPGYYEAQAPILIEIDENTTANINSYRIETQKHPNKILNFTIGAMSSGEKVLLKVRYWCFIKNNDYSYLPNNVKIPETVPENTTIWLESTAAIQSDSYQIKLAAARVRGVNDNLIELANDIALFTRARPPSTGMQDAVSTLQKGGVCTGKANLGTALFRAKDINEVPCKDLIVMPICGKERWYQIHFICEYYCPGHEWVWVETTMGQTPWEPKNDILLRVNYPEDENEAGNRRDWYLEEAGNGGVEQWFWLSTEDVYVVAGPVDKEGNYRARGWVESNFTTSESKASEAFLLTGKVWEFYTEDFEEKYEQFLPKLKNAINYLREGNPDGYLAEMSTIYEGLYPPEKLAPRAIPHSVYIIIAVAVIAICAIFLLVKKLKKH
ncbi:MAG: hypothetical protein QME47_04015 [Candidatus Thermoplasmatota archaeon]|nr:hypothetical protein [Candidatus Thermoplasmatota archaeon]